MLRCCALDSCCGAPISCCHRQRITPVVKKPLVDHQRHTGNRRVAFTTDGPPVPNSVGHRLSAGHPCGGPPVTFSGGSQVMHHYVAVGGGASNSCCNCCCAPSSTATAAVFTFKPLRGFQQLLQCS